MRATSRLVVVTSVTCGTTGTNSCASCGRTSRNQPIAPAMATIAPRMLTASLVTNPANSNVVPNASAIGHAVGAGISIVPGLFSFVCVTKSTAILFPSSAPNNVYDDEDYYPNHIHEVPIHR